MDTRPTAALRERLARIAESIPADATLGDLAGMTLGDLDPQPRSAEVTYDPDSGSIVIEGPLTGQEAGELIVLHLSQVYPQPTRMRVTVEKL